MDDAATQPRVTTDADRCSRCLQPVPSSASRCPGCGQPHSNRRFFTLLVGVAGVGALVFVMALMYYAAWRSDMMKADPLHDEQSAKQSIMVEAPPENSTAASDAAPAKPDKPPPLNEK